MTWAASAVLALAALLGACGMRTTNAYGCDITYEVIAGPLTIESEARIVLDVLLTPLENTYTVRDVTVTAPWAGREDLDPWRLFVVGRKRPIARIDGDVVTLFETSGRPFTLNRANGDAGWSQAGPMGETEYYGGCSPIAR